MKYLITKMRDPMSKPICLFNAAAAYLCLSTNAMAQSVDIFHCTPAASTYSTPAYGTTVSCPAPMQSPAGTDMQTAMYRDLAAAGCAKAKKFQWIKSAFAATADSYTANFNNAGSDYTMVINRLNSSFQLTEVFGRSTGHIVGRCVAAHAANQL